MNIPIRKSIFAQQLLNALNEYPNPFLIDLEDNGVIVARHAAYAGPFSVSITFSHTEGDIVIGSNWPTRAERCDLSAEQLASTNYPELAEAVSQMKGCDWQFLDGSPWLDGQDEMVKGLFDRDGKLLMVTPVLLDNLKRWLGHEDEEAPWIDGLFPELHEGLVGYAIRDGLPRSEVRRLGLMTGDFRGGPGGYAERVAYRGDPVLLEESMRKHGLPFTLNDRQE